MIGAIVDLIHADQRQAVQPAGGEFLGNDSREDVPDRLPADSHQLGELRLVHLLRQPRGEVVEVARVPGAASRPLDHLGQITAARAVQAPQPALDLAAHAAHVEMPPALGPVILDLQPARAAARAERLLAAQRDRHDHRLRAELHVADPRARKPEHPVISGGDPHVALLCVADLRTASRLPQKRRRRVARDVRNLQDAQPSCNATGVAKPRAARQARAAPDQPASRPNPHACRGIGRLTRASAPLSGNDRRAEPGTPQVNDPTGSGPPDSPPNDEESQLSQVGPSRPKPELTGSVVLWPIPNPVDMAAGAGGRRADRRRRMVHIGI